METGRNLVIDDEARLVIWHVDDTTSRRRLQTPWGELWRGEHLGAGLEVWVAARESFSLMMVYGPTSFFEAIAPGRHRFVLTILDSSDVA